MFEQERVIGRIQRRVLAEPAIVACFLGGSFGRGADDDYSDLDVVLVFANEPGRDLAWEQRREFAQSVMPYVAMNAFDAQHIRPYLFVTLFSNGSKVDYRYEAADILRPGPWDGRIRILKDSGGWAENHQNSSSRLSWPAPTIRGDELIAIDQRFWIMFWDVLRLLARGDSNKPFQVYLQLLSYSLPPFLMLSLRMIRRTWA